MDSTDCPEPETESLDLVARAYVLHSAELRRFAAARLRDSVAADDIVQEAYLRLAIEARAGRFATQPRAWLYRVAMNLIISGARRAATARTALSEAPFEGVDDLTPETFALRAERRRTIGTALDTVTPQGRAGLIMAAEGYSGREIARRIGRSEVATRALMCRARFGVRKVIAQAEAV